MAPPLTIVTPTRSRIAMLIVLLLSITTLLSLLIIIILVPLVALPFLLTRLVPRAGVTSLVMTTIGRVVFVAVTIQIMSAISVLWTGVRVL